MKTLNNTEFKDIPHHTNYQASEDGRIYCKSGFFPSTSTFPTSKGHYITCSVVTDDGVRRDTVIHRLIALAYHYPGPQWIDLDVNHKDGDKTNNHKDNLEWCTKGRNLKHAYETGLRIDHRQFKVFDELDNVTICKSISDIALLTGYTNDSIEVYIAIKDTINKRLDGKWTIEYDDTHTPLINRQSQARRVVCMDCSTYMFEVVDTLFEASMVIGMPRGTIQFNLSTSVRVNMLNGFHYWYEDDPNWILRAPKVTEQDIIKSKERAQRLALRTFSNLKKRMTV